MWLPLCPKPQSTHLTAIMASSSATKTCWKQTQIASKYAPSKRGLRWGFRSQSLNRESPAKDISLVTKRVLSVRLLKINELRNELTELHVKLDELQKENRALKRLQYRHEKALHKFEDTENEISQLLARHNDEMRILRERLRKSQEREQTTERKLRSSEEELSKAKGSLQKLRRLAEDKHLPERDELAKKLALVENRLDDSEKRIKDLEKNLDLSNSSFQRQLNAEKKKLCEAQEENKVFQEEVQRLNQKLKEKERELDAKNIYANRMLKPSPKKDTDIISRKKGNYFLKSYNLNRNGQVYFKGEYEMIKYFWNADLTVYFFSKENSIFLEKEEKVKMETEIDSLEYGTQISEREEEEKRKKLLLAKMYEIDKESQININVAAQEHNADIVTKPFSLEKSKRPYQFSETTEKLFNGFLEYEQPSMVTKGEIQKHQNTTDDYSSNDLTFGSYVPSFGKVLGRPVWLNQKSEFLDEPTKGNVVLDIKRERKSNLMEQLFGSSATITPPKGNDLGPFQQDSGTDKVFQDKGTVVKVNDDSDLFFSEGKTFNPKRHLLQHTASRPAVKALDYLEDEIEEVLLQ
uniref:Lebercilin LCA5 n=1 Tax=Varanus komodoensis TaxID=61221 RepID=A0A8D2M0L5_VARKO